MTQPDTPLSRLPKKQDDPAERMRNILSAEKERAALPSQTDQPARKEPKSKPRRTPERPETPASGTASLLSFRKDKLLPAFWTIASAISLAVNVVMLVVILVLLGALSQIRATALNAGSGLLGGLYNNFEMMDRAHIQTTIPVDAQVPVSFNLELNNQTAVVLSDDVTVRGAYVVINTPLIDINAPANVTLPAGTSLPIRLQMTVPVETSIPIHLDVPVDIALADTDLHKPFAGLRQIVKPFYCLVQPDALSVDGLAVCK